MGAGPGDPGLLTVKALVRLREADVVIYDRLVSEGVVSLIPQDVVKIYGGKAAGSRGGERQEELNELMLSEASSGKKVVRLKGGDPFLFSRGGEEAEFLRDHGVEFEVVPGVSSALAAPAYAGIPLTHRGYSSSVTVVTGRKAARESEVDWSKMAGSDSLVVLMGAARLEEISKELLEAGKPAETPLAAIMRGTTREQSTVTTTLGRAASGKGGVEKVEPPCVIVVGRVVSLAPRLGWLAEGWPSAPEAASGSPASRRGTSTRRSRRPRT